MKVKEKMQRHSACTSEQNRKPPAYSGSLRNADAPPLNQGKAHEAQLDMSHTTISESTHRILNFRCIEMQYKITK